MAITSENVREIFKGLENGDGGAFFERVADDVDWIVMGTHPLAGHYRSKKAFREGTFAKYIVLVHGAWADGSGWKGVYDILVKDGYNVSIVQEPETSFKDDVAATKRILALQDGPSILVAHSYGGAVITEAGTDPSVAGLVYIAAHMPDSGEKESEDGKRFPSDLAKSGAIKKTPDGFTYIDPAQFHELFAADLPNDQAAFMARSQVLNFADNFSATITTAAWRTKPSWMVVAGSDRTINPDLERWYAKRAKSHTVEVAGASHSVYVSHPKEVADVIESAARAVSK
jgi:pimeloyl-ACP methyl ester carboxylesterase